METIASNLRIIVEEVAKQLSILTGQAWQLRVDTEISDSNWRQNIDGPDSASIFVSNTWGGKGRIHLGGSFPNDVHFGYQESRPSITVAESATPERIAKEITRRLLPEYLPLLAKKLADKNAHDNFEANKLATFKAALAVIGYAVESYNGQVREEKSIGPEYIHFRTLNETQVQLDRFQVTVEQLRKINAVVPELFRKDGDR
jgi:hypothetical protein